MRTRRPGLKIKEATLPGSLFSHSRDVFRGCFRLKKHIMKMRKNLIDIWGVSYYIVSVKSWRFTGKMEQKPFFKGMRRIFFYERRRINVQRVDSPAEYLHGV